jgi:NitT/TauT family transport system permease protein
MSGTRDQGSTAERAVPRRRRRPSALAIFGTITVRDYLLVAVAGFAVVLALWLAARVLDLANPMFLPWPGEVVDRLGSLAADGTLWADIAASVGRIAVGFGLATLLAVPIGVLIGTYRFAEALIEPLVDFVRYMPVVGFVPLTIIWIGIDDPQKWSIVFIGTFFQEVLLVMDNVKRVPKELVDIGYTLGLRDRGVLQRIILRASAPAIWDTLRISLGWAWTWIVLAELVAASTGLGYRISAARRFFNTDTIIGYLIVLGILGLITDQAMKALGRWMFRWSER